MSQSLEFMLIFALLKEYLNNKQFNPLIIYFIGGFFFVRSWNNTGKYNYK